MKHSNKARLKLILISLIMITGFIFVSINFFSRGSSIVTIKIETKKLQNLNSGNSTLTNWQKAFKEVAYAYYMRGNNLQYNSEKVAYYPPEEATSQNTNYLVCSRIY